MNQELKQRLIGAIVVTSLAAIFIPMIFDDPVDNSAQTVSELAIPKAPIDTGEELAKKLPSKADQISTKLDSESETALKSDEQSDLTAFDEPVDDSSIIEPEETISTPKQDNSASISNNTTSKAIKPIKKAESIAPKQLTPAQPLAIEPINKPAKVSSELKRWYLQAGTFSKKENALSLIEQLSKQGLPNTLESFNGADGTALFRIKVGPTLDKKRALEMKAKLNAQKIESLMMTE